MNEFYFNLQRFSSYVVTADTTNNSVSVTKDGASAAGITGTLSKGGTTSIPNIGNNSLDDGDEAVVTLQGLTLVSGDSISVSDTASKYNVALYLVLPEGNYTVNGTKFSVYGNDVLFEANTYYRSNSPRYDTVIFFMNNSFIYNGTTLATVSSANSSVVYDGMTISKSSSASHTIPTVYRNPTSGSKSVSLDGGVEISNAASGKKFEIDAGDVSSNLYSSKINGVTFNYDEDTEDIEVEVTSSGFTIKDDDGDLLHTFYGSSGNNVITFDSSTETISESYSANILTAADGVYNYTGGNASISSYTAGEKIKLTANYRGLGFLGNNFIVKSNTGNLTVTNARDKQMTFASSRGVNLADVYMASGGGNVSLSGSSSLGILIGGNNSSNTITAGSGTSTLWGGAGSTSSDTLIGGDGRDTFFYGKNDGSDVINQASSSDTVNLYNVRVSDISSARVNGNTITANFKTGGSLQINGTSNTSSIFKLASGSQWQYNGSNWQRA